MTVKRTFLNIGLILMMIASAMLGSQIYENSCIVETVGTVSKLRTKTDAQEFEWIYAIIDYEIGGSKFSHEVDSYMLRQAFGDDYKSISVGDTAVFHHEKRLGILTRHFNSKHYDEIALFGIPGIILIICFFSAFKGYWSEFICEHPILFLGSALSWVFILYLWLDAGGYEDSWNGLYLVIFLPINAVLQAITWTIVGITQRKKRKKEQQESEINIQRS